MKKGIIIAFIIISLAGVSARARADVSTSCNTEYNYDASSTLTSTVQDCSTITDTAKPPAWDPDGFWRSYAKILMFGVLVAIVILSLK